MSETNEKKMQDDLKQSVHKIWLAGLGAVAMAEEEGTKFFRNLVDKGETFETRGRERYDEVKTRVSEVTDKYKDKAESTLGQVSGSFDDAVSRALRRLGVPNREEIATLTKRVEELTDVVEQLRDSKGPAKKAAAKKTAEEAPAN